MIINVPTGLYGDILPKNPSDSGSVTFTISNKTPTRTDLVYPKIPQSIIERPKNLRSKDVLRRRPTMGDLVFSVSNSSSSRKEVGNNSKIYETGQILNFEEVALKTLDPMLVSAKNEIQHDTNRLDYGQMEINLNEVKSLETKSLMIYEDLNNKLNNLKSDRKDQETIIQSHQKVINDTNRTIKALDVILAQGEDSEIDSLRIKLKNKILESEKIIEEATTKANALVIEASAVQDQIKTISTVIK